MKEYKETLNTPLQKSVSDLSLYSAGYEECQPKYSYGPICRSYQLIHFVLRGKGELHINEHIFQLSAGDVFIIPAGKVSYYEASATEPWCYAWISYMGINSQRYTYQLITSAEDRYIIHGIDTEKYVKPILDIIALQGNTTSRYLEANSILLHIMSLLFKDINFNEKNLEKNSTVDEVKFYLDVNYPENLKLYNVAKTFGIHPNYLTRIFHQAYGISPKSYIMDLKLKRACRLLTTTELPIGIISSSLSFDDQLAFSKQFKKKYSVSPSEYRVQSRLNPKE